MAKQSTKIAPDDWETMVEADVVFVGRDGSTYIFNAKRTDEMDFAKSLRDAIVESGVSQYQLAKFTGVPQTAISSFLRGSDIRLQTFNRLAAVMGFELKHRRSKMPKKRAAGTRAAKPND